MTLTIKLMTASAVVSALQKLGTSHTIYFDADGLHVNSPGVDWQLPGNNSLEMAAALIPYSQHTFDRVVFGMFISAGIIVPSRMFG